jgi:hypothetical protein
MNFIKIKKLFYIVNSALIACLLLIGGCNHMPLQTGKKHNKTIEDIAYDKNSKEECLVYVKENDVFEPYIVISSDYDGNVLLLRKDLLAEKMPFNQNETHMWASYEYGGYYEDSSIDKYLNTEFTDTLSESVKASIVSSNIVITDKSSLGVTGNATTTISRKVFLLSLEELNGAKSNASVSEGKTLKYFADDYNRRVANLPNGEKCAYWTRTPETWETYTVFTIGNNGTGSGSADVDSGVRPAFCLKKSTAITKRTDIESGQTVYVIE